MTDPRFPKIPPAPKRPREYESPPPVFATERPTGRTNAKVVTYGDLARVFDEADPSERFALVELVESYIKLEPEDAAALLRAAENPILLVLIKGMDRLNEKDRQALCYLEDRLRVATGKETKT
jgi:hypothetical protein